MPQFSALQVNPVMIKPALKIVRQENKWINIHKTITNLLNNKDIEEPTGTFIQLIVKNEPVS